MTRQHDKTRQEDVTEPAALHCLNVLAESRYLAVRRDDRPRIYTGVEPAEVAILAAAAALLEELPYRDLGIEEIANHVGVSKPSIYLHFSSKAAVAAALIARAIDDLEAVVHSIDGHGPDRVKARIQALVDTWARHRVALRVASEYWPSVPELRALCLDAVSSAGRPVAREITRARGRATGVPADRLALALIWGTERVLYVAGLGVDANIPDERAALVPLTALWVGTIYSPGA